ncbi:MAG: ComEC/Rec2 family competence protein [Armatimonadota bacterium]
MMVVAGYAALRTGEWLRPRTTLLFPPSTLVLSVVPVGHGEAAWIRTPAGRFIVIGAGPAEGAPVLARDLRAAGADKIDLLVLPYPYADCVGGAPETIRKFPVVEAIENGWPRVNQRQEETRSALRATGAKVSVVRDGDSRVVDGVRLDVLAPGAARVERSPAAGNNSVVVRASYGKTSFLFAGGIEAAGEAALLGRGPERLRSKWLRAPRFGTKDSASAEFLEAVGADDIVIAVGPNRSGVPDATVLRRIVSTGARPHRTDQSPNGLYFLSDGSTIRRASE